MQTRVKLSIFGDYVRNFVRASKRAPDRIYIDGFAGGARGIDPTTGDEYDGSAALALAVDPPFTEVFLVEQDEGRVGVLQKLSGSHPSVRVFPGDVNVEMPKLLAGVNRRAPTLAFLDPEGTQLHWKTLELLAAHKRGYSKTKIELLILFPLQMAVLRLLNFKTGVIKPGHGRRLDTMLGAESPYREIVSMRMTGKISTPEETEIAFLNAYADGLHRRLGYRHVLHREVAGATGRPFYYLVFASDSDVGREIMRYEFGASHTEQGQLFNVADYTPGISYDPDRERTYGI
jgi:three-Cys-motif partner protein